MCNPKMIHLYLVYNSMSLLYYSKNLFSSLINVWIINTVQFLLIKITCIYRNIYFSYYLVTPEDMLLVVIHKTSFISDPCLSLYIKLFLFQDSLHVLPTTKWCKLIIQSYCNKNIYTGFLEYIWINIWFIKKKVQSESLNVL